MDKYSFDLKKGKVKIEKNICEPSYTCSVEDIDVENINNPLAELI